MFSYSDECRTEKFLVREKNIAAFSCCGKQNKNLQNPKRQNGNEMHELQINSNTAIEVCKHHLPLRPVPLLFYSIAPTSI